MQIKDTIIRHKTLFRLISTVLVAAIGLFVFYGWSVLQSSQEQIDDQHEQNYAGIAAEFNTGFADQLPVMMSTVRLFQRENNVTRVWLESHFYNFIVLIDELADYRKSIWIADDMFLILQDASYVLSTKYKYDIDFFFNREGPDGKLFESMLRHAVYDNPASEMTVLSGFPYGVEKLYIAVPFSNAQAIVLVSLTEESIRRYLYGVADDSGTSLGFLIFDEEGMLLFKSEKINADLLLNKEFTSFLSKGSSTEKLHITETDYFVAQSYSPKYKLKFVVIQERQPINQSLDRFYIYLRQITMIVFILLILIMSSAIYINFLPIAKLVKGLNKQKRPVSEIEAIYSVLSDYEIETEQMQGAMKDYILHRLIEGHSVSDDALAELDLQPNDNFCVLAMAGFVLTTDQCKQLVQRVKEEIGIRVFITTLLYDRYILALCTQAQASGQSPFQNQRRSLAAVIQKQVVNLIENAAAPRVGVGMAVNLTEDIHRSYLGALTAIESESEERIILYEENVDMRLGDLEINYTKKLLVLFNYMQQGDQIHSQIALRDLFDYLQLIAPSVIVENYFCYDIINTYMKHVQKSDFKMNSEISEAIHHGDSLQTLFLCMHKSVDEYCAWMSLRQEKQQNESAKQIAEFVNSHFANPALTLEMIADHFCISIYMVSRMLKEYWNCGYKEYLTAKRIQFSKHLLDNDALSIADIAAASGFYDALQFSRTFRANMGVSPIQYRKITVSK